MKTPAYAATVRRSTTFDGSEWPCRPKYLFSGLTKCAVCGGGYVMAWRETLACFNARSRGTCANRLTIDRREVEHRVLNAVREKLMRKDLFEEFCHEYTREMNRLRMARQAGSSQVAANSHGSNAT